MIHGKKHSDTIMVTVIRQATVRINISLLAPPAVYRVNSVSNIFCAVTPQCTES